LQGKVALITGSTGGMGLETARVLARNGALIALHGLGNPAEIASVAGQIGALGVAARHFRHNLSVHDQAASLVSDVPPENERTPVRAWHRHAAAQACTGGGR
jgi:NAD(P)-dependent dehydrogenase (short-subunit alcohol dehydrogenase family)